MTSVQNHRQLLSGNRIVFSLILSILVLISCSAPAKVVVPTKPTVKEEVKPEVYNPKTKRYEPANPENTKVDTILWRDSGEPPFITDKSVGTFPRSEKPINSDLNIALLLPLSEDDLNTDLGIEGTEKYFHYYAGLKMALDKISLENNRKINLNVLEVKSSQDAILPVLQNINVQSADLIIGPLRRDHLNETAKFVRDRNIPMVAPWNSFRTIENLNENYILLKSSLPTHCEMLTDYILKQFKPEDIAIVGREKTKSLMNYFQSEIDRNLGPRSVKVRQCIVKDDYAFKDDYKYLDSLKSVYIVTEFEDPDVVFNFLRHINIMRNNKEVTVIGMPSWQDYSRDYNSLFSQLHVTISASSFPDIDHDEVLKFRNDFFRLYQNFPLKEAYEGYDAIQYLSLMLLKYGRSFYLNGDMETYQGLATVIRLEKIVDTSKPIDDRLNNIQCIENKALHILKFDQFRFYKVQ
ncbi:MAG: ABC transporter substrate-binding protein [Saprospiraceae bacterium]